MKKHIRARLLIFVLLVSVIFTNSAQAGWSDWIYFGEIFNDKSKETLIRAEIKVYSEDGEYPIIRWRLINKSERLLTCVKLGVRTYHISDKNKKTGTTSACQTIGPRETEYFDSEVISTNSTGSHIADVDLADISYELSGKSHSVKF